jgi:hypothetical protein
LDEEGVQFRDPLYGSPKSFVSAKICDFFKKSQILALTTHLRSLYLFGYPDEGDVCDFVKYIQREYKHISKLMLFFDGMFHN